MKALFGFSVFIILTATVFSQEEETISKSELKKLAKEDKKAKKALEEEQIAKLTDSMLVNKKFVLEADYISDGKGQRIPVSSTINFVVVDSLECILQIGSPGGIGWNGVGGVTVEGNISKYDLRIKEGKKGKSYYIMIVIMSSQGIYDISFQVSQSGYTDATVRSTTSGQLVYSGKLVEINKSRVYKGTPRY
jgi:Domain of unknown function (DUF4251)